MKPTDSPENHIKCNCPKCSLFTDCNAAREENLFCGMGKSTCPMDSSKICICGQCPIHKENGLEGGYFCISGLAE
ncbi:MAG: DUF2769 domain-containing protein [Candidatus Paceibacterota bacterium]